MVKPYLNKIGGNVDDDVAMFTGGLNVYEDKAFLQPDQMPFVMNMCITNPPKLETRPSRVTWATEMHDPELNMNDNKVVAVFTYAEDDIFLITRRTSDNKTFLGRYYKTIQNGLYRFVPTTVIPIDTYPRYYFAYCPIGVNKYLYIGNESFKARIDLTIAPSQGWGYTEYQDHFGIPVWHKSKMWLARPSSNMIEWSNSLQPDDFTTGQAGFAGELYVTRRKGNIVNIISFDDKLMVFCEHSIHAIYGDSGDPSNQNFFQLVDITNNLGLLSPDCLANGAERLYWLGDNKEVYEYTGASLRMVSRPGKSRNDTISVGGVSGLIDPRDISNGQLVDVGGSISKFVATSEKLYINIWNAHRGHFANEKILLVFDIYNRTWWCEDGEFDTIAEYSGYNNRILLAKSNGDILISDEGHQPYGTSYTGNDLIYDFQNDSIRGQPIKYEFHTRVYGADGTDLRESISKVWFQARANAQVYLNDVWTSEERWAKPTEVLSNYVQIGELKKEYQNPTQPTKYRPDKYEQQVCHLQKMYGERLNTFQIIVKGEGSGIFYLMKRVWRAE